MRENVAPAAQPEPGLADQVHYTLPPPRWEAFCRALDAPPRELPALRRLLTERSVLAEGWPAT
jgi:hypothetical protein